MAFFCGMTAGILLSTFLMFTDIQPLYVFPFLFGFCLLVCIGVSLLSQPDDMSVLKNFYQKTRPWGCWQPVVRALQEDGVEIAPNSKFKNDAMNMLIGVVWHTSLTAAPIFMVIQAWDEFRISVSLIIFCSIWLKHQWWDKLPENE